MNNLSLHIKCECENIACMNMLYLGFLYTNAKKIYLKLQHLCHNANCLSIAFYVLVLICTIYCTLYINSKI